MSGRGRRPALKCFPPRALPRFLPLPTLPASHPHPRPQPGFERGTAASILNCPNGQCACCTRQPLGRCGDSRAHCWVGVLGEWGGGEEGEGGEVGGGSRGEEALVGRRRRLGGFEGGGDWGQTGPNKRLQEEGGRASMAQGTGVIRLGRLPSRVHLGGRGGGLASGEEGRRALCQSTRGRLCKEHERAPLQPITPLPPQLIRQTPTSAHHLPSHCIKERPIRLMTMELSI